jgi:hypothetical protein
MTKTDHKDFLQEAARVLGERGVNYGGVEESFTRAAGIASLILGKSVSARDVALVLHSVKLARLSQSHDHFDSYVDGINYLAFAGEFSGATKGSPTTNQMAEALKPELKMPKARMPMGEVTTILLNREAE